MIQISVEPFEKNSTGKMTHFISMINENGTKIVLCDLGASIISIFTRDCYDELRDIVLGYQNLENYEIGDTYFGATIGRCCNRIKNAEFTLNNKHYKLCKNDGNNHLHGGVDNFARKIWQYTIEKNSVIFSLHSKDGEEGYPGNMDIQARYTLDEDNSLKIEYYAISDQDTVCNITNHTYFNLDGHNSGDCTSQYLYIDADYYLPNDDTSIPTGEFEYVEDTPFDFRTITKIGKRISQRNPQLLQEKGYNHGFVLNHKKHSRDACAYSKKSGIMLECWTSQPSIQLYTANYVNTFNGKENKKYGKWSGFCLETQNFTDAIHQPKFPTPVLKASTDYYQITIYKFSKL